MGAFAGVSEQMHRDSMRIAALMSDSPAMQPLKDSADALARALQPLNEQLARLAATEQALSHLFDSHSAEAQQRVAVLQQRRKELAEHHAGLSARLAYVLRTAEKQGSATHYVVVLALSGDTQARHDLSISAARGNVLAACVLALISEIAALTEQVLDLVADVAHVLTRSALERLEHLDLTPPRRVRAGTASPNGPPAALYALSVMPSTCLDTPTSPRQGEALTIT